MNNTQEITEFDLSLLPGWDEELKCESAHTESICSVEVTHITNVCYNNPWMVCAVSAANHLEAMREPHRPCLFCGQFRNQCWTVVPV